jgi:3-deoxy-D-manno-octulosonic-acid transferase
MVAALKARYPDHRILLTHMTPTGRRTSEELFGDGVERAYLPYDYPCAVRRFLRHFRPRVGVIMETELWPNLVAMPAGTWASPCCWPTHACRRSRRGAMRAFPT